MIEKENNMNKRNIALVTGASSGIGEALTRELISKGWVVVGIARRIEKLNAIKNETGPSFSPIVCDVSNKSDIHRPCKNILDKGLCPTLFFLNVWQVKKLLKMLKGLQLKYMNALWQLIILAF